MNSFKRIVVSLGVICCCFAVACGEAQVESTDAATEQVVEEAEEVEETKDPEEELKEYIQSCVEIDGSIYQNLMRHEDDYVGKHYKFNLKITQLISDKEYRGHFEYDDISTLGEDLYLEDNRTWDTTKILNDDKIVCYATYAGTTEVVRAIGGTTDYVPLFHIYAADIPGENTMPSFGNTSGNSAVEEAPAQDNTVDTQSDSSNTSETATDNKQQSETANNSSSQSTGNNDADSSEDPVLVGDDGVTYEYYELSGFYVDNFETAMEVSFYSSFSDPTEVGVITMQFRGVEHKLRVFQVKSNLLQFNDYNTNKIEYYASVYNDNGTICMVLNGNDVNGGENWVFMMEEHWMS